MSLKLPGNSRNALEIFHRTFSAPVGFCTLQVAERAEFLSILFVAVKNVFREICGIYFAKIVNENSLLAELKRLAVA